jgi:hypothetical protein
MGAAGVDNQLARKAHTRMPARTARAETRDGWSDRKRGHLFADQDIAGRGETGTACEPACRSGACSWLLALLPVHEPTRPRALNHRGARVRHPIRQSPSRDAWCARQTIEVSRAFLTGSARTPPAEHRPRR